MKQSEAVRPASQCVTAMTATESNTKLMIVNIVHFGILFLYLVGQKDNIPTS